MITDNHFHAVLSAADMPRVIAALKRHTARQILQLLEDERAEWLLHQLRQHRATHKTEIEHQVWQEGYHPQSLPTDEIMLQKLEYLHNIR